MRPRRFFSRQVTIASSRRQSVSRSSRNRSERNDAASMSGRGAISSLRKSARAMLDPPRNGEGDHAKHGGGARERDPNLEGKDHPRVPLHHPAGGPPPPRGRIVWRKHHHPTASARLAAR